MTHNSRGDIIGIYNGDGILRAQYKYDAWGNVLSVTDENGNAITSATHVGNLNPFRYRGYYYDTESGFYYLVSRYYDPVTHRFINADTTDILLSSNNLNNKNLFSYSDNNPISRMDDGGAFWHIAIGAVIGGFVNTAATVVTNVVDGNNWYDGIGVAALSGMASGALASTGVGMFGSILGNAAIGGATEFVNQAIRNKGFNVGKIASETLFGGIAGAIGGSGFGSKHLNTAGKQATKRVTNAVKNKTSGGIKKAVVNYAKNTKTILTREVKKSIISPTKYTTILKTILIGGEKISLTYNPNLGHCNHA